jgi:hypothetical protein
MTFTRQLTTSALVALAFGVSASLASAQTHRPEATDRSRELNLTAYTELLRADLRAEQVEVITEVMEFTEAEDAKFWPIYREYEVELAKINDDRIALVREYADNYAALTDDTADRLATRALELEARRQAVKAACYNRLKTVISPRTAARFLQVENQILLLLDLQIAASLPVVE